MIRNTRGAVCAATSPTFFFGTAPAGACQSPNAASSCGMIFSSEVSPATRMRTLSGRSHCDWKRRRSSAVSDLIEASSPLPVSGMLYAWPLPYSSGGKVRSASPFGWVFSCAMLASHCARMRSMSSALNAGLRTVSANSASDGCSWSLSALSEAPHTSRSQSVPMIAPRRWRRLATSTESSDLVLSPSSVAVKLAVPSLPPWSAA